MEFRDEVLSVLKRNGSDTSKLHAFEYHLLVPSKKYAERVVAKIQQSGFNASMQPSGRAWLCIAETKLIPKDANLNDHARFFREVASAVSGDFDGWESKVVD